MAVDNLANNSAPSRYQGLIISIVIFLGLIGALLSYTFYTSSLLEQNTASIEASNQVANDAQAVIKDIFDLQISYGENVNSPHMQTVLKRLSKNSDEIDALLLALQSGTAYVDAQGDAISLPTIKDPETLQALVDTQEEWGKLKPKLQDYLAIAGDIRQDTSAQLAVVGEQAKTSSLAMNSSLNQLTADVFEDAERQADTIRIIQLLGVGAILVYFLIFVFFFLKRLRETDAAAAAARRETQEIMQTVSTGLFLLDKDLHIGQQHSRALESIIGSDRLAGEDLTQVLRGRISDKDLNTTRQFIEQLYNPRVKEKLVDDLNPLQKVMLRSGSNDVSQSNRYLDFKFSRVYEDKDIARILVNVVDVSDAVKLEQRLEQERAQNDMQIEMLTTILNVNPNIIQEFIVNTKNHIEKINNVLKNPGSSQFELENKLKLIFREMHSLKGESSALKLHSFTKIASAAEDKLQILQNQGKLSGNDFLPLAVDLEELLSLSNTIEKLGERINQVSPTVTPTEQAVQNVAIDKNDDIDTVTTTPVNEPKVIITQHAQETQHEAPITIFGDVANSDVSKRKLEEYYEEFSQQIAERQHKKVRLEASGLDLVSIPNNLNSTVKEIVIQLLRNAIVHGIETPTVRLVAGKDETGLLTLNMSEENRNLVITLQDDGAGIDYEKIRQKLIETGKYDNQSAQNLDKQQLLNALFSSGFSTKTDVDEDGGRGVGLDIVKDRIQEHGGQLDIQSQLGEMTKFVVNLPLN